MCWIKIWGFVQTNFYKMFFGAWAGRSRDFLGGAGAEKFRSRGKMSRLHNTDFFILEIHQNKNSDTDKNNFLWILLIKRRIDGHKDATADIRTQNPEDVHMYITAGFFKQIRQTYTRAFRRDKQKNAHAPGSGSGGRRWGSWWPLRTPRRHWTGWSRRR